ncbi:MAG: AtpZ/AtpI family protein [Syntrophaceae bacterium]
MGFIGLYGGIWLDRITGMMPLLTIVGLITGIALGFLGLIYEIKGDMKD